MYNFSAPKVKGYIYSHKVSCKNKTKQKKGAEAFVHPKKITKNMYYIRDSA